MRTGRERPSPPSTRHQGTQGQPPKERHSGPTESQPSREIENCSLPTWGKVIKGMCPFIRQKESTGKEAQVAVCVLGVFHIAHGPVDAGEVHVGTGCLYPWVSRPQAVLGCAPVLLDGCEHAA